MKLPNGDRAIVTTDKIVHYCLNKQHPQGGDKAVTFDIVLGLNMTNWTLLRDLLLHMAATAPAVLRRVNRHGEHYTIDFEFTGRNGRTAPIRSNWIIEGEALPRLTSAYIRRA